MILSCTMRATERGWKTLLTPICTLLDPSHWFQIRHSCCRVSHNAIIIKSWWASAVTHTASDREKKASALRYTPTDSDWLSPFTTVYIRVASQWCLWNSHWYNKSHPGISLLNDRDILVLIKSSLYLSLGNLWQPVYALLDNDKNSLCIPVAPSTNMI